MSGEILSLPLEIQRHIWTYALTISREYVLYYGVMLGPRRRFQIGKWEHGEVVNKEDAFSKLGLGLLGPVCRQIRQESWIFWKKNRFYVASVYSMGDLFCIIPKMASYITRLHIGLHHSHCVYEPQSQYKWKSYGHEPHHWFKDRTEIMRIAPKILISLTEFSCDLGSFQTNESGMHLSGIGYHIGGTDFRSLSFFQCLQKFPKLQAFRLFDCQGYCEQFSINICPQPWRKANHQDIEEWMRERLIATELDGTAFALATLLE